MKYSSFYLFYILNNRNAREKAALKKLKEKLYQIKDNL